MPLFSKTLKSHLNPYHTLASIPPRRLSNDPTHHISLLSPFLTNQMPDHHRASEPQPTTLYVSATPQRASLRVSGTRARTGVCVAGAEESPMFRDLGNSSRRGETGVGVYCLTGSAWIWETGPSEGGCCWRERAGSV